MVASKEINELSQIDMEGNNLIKMEMKFDYSNMIKIIDKPSAMIFPHLSGIAANNYIEQFGRICYKSEDKITDNSSEPFIKMLIRLGHESVLEHISCSFKIVTDRGISHELVRHRIASYSQESTRYCNYKGKPISFVKPINIEYNTPEFDIWEKNCIDCTIAYNELINKGVKPQIARSVLNTSLKTELIMTCNLREWRHFIKLRTNSKAHPDMQYLAIQILLALYRYFPVVFEDLYNKIFTRMASDNTL